MRGQLNVKTVHLCHSVGLSLQRRGQVTYVSHLMKSPRSERISRSALWLYKQQDLSIFSFLLYQK